MKRLAVVQSSYIPWKGYFDLIKSVDEFILYDHVQYTRRDWRNRNRIKTRDGPKWLTIPVEVKSKYHQSIQDVRTSDPNWPRRHWESIRHSYARARYFDDYEKHEGFKALRAVLVAHSEGLRVTKDGALGPGSIGAMLDRGREIYRTK